MSRVGRLTPLAQKEECLHNFGDLFAKIQTGDVWEVGRYFVRSNGSVTLIWLDVEPRICSACDQNTLVTQNGNTSPNLSELRPSPCRVDLYSVLTSEIRRATNTDESCNCATLFEFRRSCDAASWHSACPGKEQRTVRKFCFRRFPMKKDTPMDRLDPARTALVVVHMVKGVAGEVDTPFNRIFRRRAEEKGTHGSPETAAGRVPHGQGERREGGLHRGHVPARAPRGHAELPAVAHALRQCVSLLEGTPAVDVIDDLAPRPDEPVVRGQAANGFDRTELDTILRQAGVDTLVLVGIATDVAVESTARAACDLGYRTIVVSDACTADSDEAHARSLDVLRKWFGETAAADEVLSALGDERTDSGRAPKPPGLAPKHATARERRYDLADDSVDTSSATGILTRRL